MRNDQYFRHDASASANQKLITLMLKEGARGYGVYWILLEMLRKRNDFRLPLDFLGAVSSICHTHRRVVERVVRDYDLFVVEDGYFYSPGMNKRMGAFLAKISKNSKESTPDSDGNELKSSDLSLLSARVEEEKRGEQSNSSRETEAAAAAAVAALESPLFPIRSWETLVDEMAADRSWMDMVGAHSALGQLYIDHRDEVVDLFRQHIRLYDKGGGLLRRNDVRQYCANYLAAGSRTCQGVRQRLLDALRQRQTDDGVSPYETIVDGHRTYLGRPIPDDAPPRPDEYAVWNEQTHRWER